MICGKAFCCCLLLNCIWFLLWDKFIGKRFRVHLAINTSIFDFELLRAKLKSTGICNLLVHYRYHQLITEYIIIDMMQYYYLRVSRRDVRRIGKHSSSHSVFLSGVHGSYGCELCRVPIPSFFGDIHRYEH